MPSPLAIAALDVRPLDVPLRAPFTIATSRLDAVRNVALRLQLHGGAVGWGEIATLPPVTHEDQPAALAAARDAAAWLPGRDAAAWRDIAAELADRAPDLPAVHAGIEMAVIDALARHHGIPLWRLLAREHGAEPATPAAVVTDVTIPICPAPEAEQLARDYRDRGFATIKTKVGLDVAADLDRLAAIRRGHPGCALVLDANEGYTAEDALQLVRELQARDMTPALLEQPVGRDDWNGLARVTREAGVLVAADESCRTPEDARRIVDEGLAHVLNIKLAKCGVAQALEIAAIGRAARLGLMIGAMVETRLSIGFAAHFAAGLGIGHGDRDFIDLDTPLLMAEDPIDGGYTAEGPRYDLAAVTAGHGGEVRGW